MPCGPNWSTSMVLFLHSSSGSVPPPLPLAAFCLQPLLTGQIARALHRRHLKPKDDARRQSSQSRLRSCWLPWTEHLVISLSNRNGLMGQRLKYEINTCKQNSVHSKTSCCSHRHPLLQPEAAPFTDSTCHSWLELDVCSLQLESSSVWSSGSNLESLMPLNAAATPPPSMQDPQALSCFSLLEKVEVEVTYADYGGPGWLDRTITTFSLDWHMIRAFAAARCLVPNSTAARATTARRSSTWPFSRWTPLRATRGF